MEFIIDIPKSVQLQAIVRNFWQVDRTYPQVLNETIIPKGTIEIIFNLYPTLPIRGMIQNRKVAIPKCFVSGNNTVPLQLEIPTRQVFFGAYLNPTALKKLFRINADDFANQCVDLTLIDPSINLLWNELGEKDSFDERVSVFSSWLLERLPVVSRHEKLFDNVLNSALTSVTATSLSEKLCYSPRHLSRKLLELTGMNLEHTLLYKKYLQSVDLIHHSEMQLTEIAHACNFSDQSHFSRTFKSFTQLSPNQYRGVKSNIAGHIFQFVR